MSLMHQVMSHIETMEVGDVQDIVVDSIALRVAVMSEDNVVLLPVHMSPELRQYYIQSDPTISHLMVHADG